MRSRASDYRTVNSLNSNRHDIAWYWRLLAFVSPCLILGGFLILPATFDMDAQLRVSKASLGIFSVAMLTAGFSSTGLVCFACKSLVFQADNIFLPSLTSSTLGLLTIFYCFIISPRYSWNTAALLVTVGSAVSMIVYASLLIYTHRRIAAIRRNRGDPQEPIGLIQQPLVSPGLSYHEPRLFDNHIANMYPTAARQSSIQEPQPPPPPAVEISEEDLLRQQMLMLLMNKSEPSISTDSAANTFNRIDFTPTDEPESTPTINIDQSAGPEHSASTSSSQYYGYDTPPVANVHAPQPSWPGNLQLLQPWDGIWRAGPRPPQLQTIGANDTMRREERRREIEQGR